MQPYGNHSFPFAPPQRPYDAPYERPFDRPYERSYERSYETPMSYDSQMPHSYDAEYHESNAKRFRTEESAAYNEHYPLPMEEKPMDMYDGPVKTYKQFLMHLPDDVTPEESRTLYDLYKKEVQRRDCRHYFDGHKTEEWFREMYDPSAFAKLRDERNQYLSKQRTVFLEAFTNQTLIVPNLDTETPFFESHLSIDGFDKPEFSKVENANIDMDDPVYADEMADVSTRKTLRNTWVYEYATVFVKRITPSVTRSALQTAFEKYGTVEKVFVSEPLRDQGFARLAWITLDSREAAAAAIKGLQRTKISDCELLLSVSQHPNRAPKRAPASSSDPTFMKLDYEVTCRIIRAFDEEKGFDPNNPILAESQKPVRELLDTNIFYLRKVHNFCFYCGEEHFDAIELVKKCGTIHIRGKHSKTDDPANCSWKKSLEKRITDRLANPDSLFKGAFAAETKAIDEFCDQNTIYVGTERFRCNICPKKVFKAPDFVKKHLLLKHPEPVEERRNQARDAQFLKAFLDDANRPSPAPTLAPSASASATSIASSLASAIVPASAALGRPPTESAPVMNTAEESVSTSTLPKILPGTAESFALIVPVPYEETRERINYEDLGQVLSLSSSYYRTAFD